jgi:hypothetical protein
MRGKGNPAEDQGRRAERRTLSAAARLRPNSWSSIEVAMLDLSEFGFRARSEARFNPAPAFRWMSRGLGLSTRRWSGEERRIRRAVHRADQAWRCLWTFEERHAALAQLLVARARANSSGRSAAETRLRREILSALPMHKGGAAA